MVGTEGGMCVLTSTISALDLSYDVQVYVLGINPNELMAALEAGVDSVHQGRQVWVCKCGVLCANAVTNLRPSNKQHRVAQSCHTLPGGCWIYRHT